MYAYCVTVQCVARPANWELSLWKPSLLHISLAYHNPQTVPDMERSLAYHNPQTARYGHHAQAYIRIVPDMNIIYKPPGDATFTKMCV